jgi:hypothetical protein
LEIVNQQKEEIAKKHKFTVKEVTPTKGEGNKVISNNSVSGC